MRAFNATIRRRQRQQAAWGRQRNIDRFWNHRSCAHDTVDSFLREKIAELAAIQPFYFTPREAVLITLQQLPSLRHTHRLRYWETLEQLRFFFEYICGERVHVPLGQISSWSALENCDSAVAESIIASREVPITNPNTNTN